MLGVGDLGFYWTVLGFVPATGWRLAMRLILDASVFLSAVLVKDQKPDPFISPQIAKPIAKHEYFFANSLFCFAACVMAGVSAPTAPSLIYLILGLVTVTKWSFEQPGERRTEATEWQMSLLRYFCIIHLLAQQLYNVVLKDLLNNSDIWVRVIFRTDDRVEFAEWYSGVKHYIHLQDLGIFLFYMSLSFRHMLTIVHDDVLNMDGIFSYGVSIFGITDARQLIALESIQSLDSVDNDMESDSAINEILDGSAVNMDQLSESQDPTREKELPSMPIFGGRTWGGSASVRSEPIESRGSRSTYESNDEDDWMEEEEARRVLYIEDKLWMNLFLARFLKSYGCVLCVIVALVWAMVYFSLQSLILLLICMALRPGLNGIMLPAWKHRGCVLGVVVYYSLLISTNFIMNFDVSAAERLEIANSAASNLETIMGNAGGNQIRGIDMVNGMDELGFKLYKNSGVCLFSQFAFLVITAASARCISPPLYKDEAEEKAAHCPCGCMCEIEPFRKRVHPSMMTTMTVVYHILRSVVVRWFWIIAVFVIYIYGLSEMVLISTVYLIAIVVSLVFFDVHQVIFGFLVIYGQIVVLVSCVWQYSWMNIDDSLREELESLAGLKRLSDDQVWKFIGPQLGVLAFVIFARLCFLRRLRWNRHLNRSFEQLKAFKQQS